MKFLAKVSQSPYDDYILNNTSYLEEYEYQVHSIIDNQEIDIDIISLVYGNQMYQN